MNKDNILEIRNISVDFLTAGGRLKAVRGASLDVPSGKIVGIVGESGCGKSTLSSAIIRLMSDNAILSGDGIIFKGSDLLSISREEIRALRGDQITMIFQDPMTSLNPVLSIGTQMVDIQYRSGISRKEKRKKAAEMLSMVGIPDAMERLKHYPHEFSGGMRQRICIAMALLSKPSLIIADEPTTALDVTLEAQIVHLMKDLQKRMGCSIICVSHHLGMIAELCHEIVVMYAGEIVEKGDVRDIFHSPAHPYTQRLLECDPANIHEKSKKLPTIEGEIPDLVNLPDGCIFQDRCHRVQPVCRESSPVYMRVFSGACKHVDSHGSLLPGSIQAPTASVKGKISESHIVKCHLYSGKSTGRSI